MKKTVLTIFAFIILVFALLPVNTVLFASSIIVVNSAISFDKDSGEVIYQGYGRMLPSVSSYLLYDSGIEPTEVSKLLIKDGTTILDEYALMGAYESNNWINLTEMTLPKSIKKIEGDFSRCPSLKIINYAGTKEDWNKIIIRDNQNELFSKLEFNYSVDVPKSDESLSANAGNEFETVEILPYKKISCTFNYITDELVISGEGSLYMPIYVYDTNCSVSRLFLSGYDEDNLKIAHIRDVVIENGITKLCEGNFEHEGLNSITIPKSIKKIEESCFGTLADDEKSTLEVFYEGTKEDWDKIKIGKWNEMLTKGNIHFSENASTDNEKADISQNTTYIALGISVAVVMISAATVVFVVKKKKNK